MVEEGATEVFLETRSLMLRRLTETDVGNLFELDSDPEVVRYANPGGETTPYEDVRDRLLPRLLSYYDKYDGYGFYAADEKYTGRFVGWFFLRPVPVDGHMPDKFERVELGYRLKRSEWGKGYATEGSKALLEKGFRELGAECVVADVIAENVASVRVLEKLGFVFEKRFIGEDGDEEVRYVMSADEHGRSGDALVE